MMIVVVVIVVIGTMIIIIMPTFIGLAAGRKIGFARNGRTNDRPAWRRSGFLAGAGLSRRT
jgi:hypothetical protein